MPEATSPRGAVLFRFGTYTLDPRGRRLLRGDAVVPLTAKAFETLEALVECSGRTVAKDELLTRVWPGIFVQEDTLAQNISTLRKTLGETPESPKYILTVPREGYRFIAPVEVVQPESARGDLRLSEGTAPPRQRFVARWPFGKIVYYAAGLGTGLIVAMAASRVPHRPAAQVPSTFEVFEPDDARFSTSGGALALSPDGRTLAFLATDRDGTDNIWIRPLDALASTKLAGTADASQPFWSPDGQWLAFFSGGFLKRIDISRGVKQAICPLPGPDAVAGSWSTDGLILFSILGQGLFKVDAGGGTAEPVVPPGTEGWRIGWPSFLPDGHRVLFTVMAPAGAAGIYVGSLADAGQRRLIDDISSSSFAAPGYILYASAGVLVASGLDPGSLRRTTAAMPVAEHVWVNESTHRAVFSASQTGVIAFREPQSSRLRWINRAGDVLSSGPAAVYRGFTVSRNGRVIAEQLDPLRGTYDLYLHGSSWDSTTRLTFDPANDFRPLWSADDAHVVFAREGTTGWQLYDLELARPGSERPLLPAPSPGAVQAVSWNGDLLEYVSVAPQQAPVFWRVHPARSEQPEQITGRDRSAGNFRRSADLKWLAYTMKVFDSRIPHTAVYVGPWPSGSGQLEIAASGSSPRWRDDSRELYYIAPDGDLIAAPLEFGHLTGRSALLHKTEALLTSGLAGDAYDAAPDGQRFLIKVPSRRPAIVVMSAWQGRKGE